MKCKIENCHSHSLRNGEYCYQHSPDISQKEKYESRSRGGSHKRKHVPELEFDTIQDVKSCLSKVLNELMSSNTDILPRSRAVSLLCNSIILCIREGDIEERLDILEKKIEERIPN